MSSTLASAAELAIEFIICYFAPAALRPDSLISSVSSIALAKLASGYLERDRKREAAAASDSAKTKGRLKKQVAPKTRLNPK